MLFKVTFILNSEIAATGFIEADTQSEALKDLSDVFTCDNLVVTLEKLEKPMDQNEADQ